MTGLRIFSRGIFLFLLPLAACDSKKPAPMAPPPPKVTVAHPIVRDVTQWDEYTGRLEAVELVEVKARISGFVESVPFKEGALVHQGDVLYTIDPRLFQAQLDNAKAAVIQEEAKLQLARDDLTRGEQVAKSGVITPEELDTRRATVRQAEGSVDAAKAAQEAAALNVEWCKVTAPISGRISNKFVTAGNMITGGAGQTTVLTTITSVDPIYCYVDADEASVLKYQKLARENKRASAANGPIECFMGLANENGFPHTGVVDFVDNRINPTTGTRRARGVFANPEGTLLPGFFARLRVVGEELKNALLVIDDVVGIDQDRKYLFIVHADKTVERRTVTTGPLIGELRVIETGLAPDDLVVANGLTSLIAVRPGGTVDPTETQMPEHRLPMPPAPPASKSAATAASQAATAEAPR